MRLLKIVLFIMVIIVLLSYSNPVMAKPLNYGECGAILSPYKQSPASCYGTVVVDYTWLSLRPNDDWWYYRLRIGDKVKVDYQENGYYAVTWYFDGSRDPLYGWVKINNILLDRDVVQ
jgi:hypothetical protein